MLYLVNRHITFSDETVFEAPDPISGWPTALPFFIKTKENSVLRRQMRCRNHSSDREKLKIFMMSWNGLESRNGQMEMWDCSAFPIWL